MSTGKLSRNGSKTRAELLLAAGKNIYLAGFMGTGKTSTARAIARMLGVPWLDLDEAIVREEGLSVSEIFAQRGERAFRNAEHRALKAVVEGAGAVVALGGGAVCFERNRALLRATGPVVLLTAPAETILKRVGRSQDRPLLAGGDAPARVRALLVRRMQDYRRYRLRVDTTELTPAGAAEAVLQVVDHAGRQADAARARDMAARRGGTCR
ncbi:MAG: shikimate kinase [Candidatus Methylomirabilia bacterium]